MENAGHYKYWKEDFNLLKELGVEFLRYSPPYDKAHLAPDKYDWSFADETFKYLQQLGITPIVDMEKLSLRAKKKNVPQVPTENTAFKIEIIVNNNI